MSRPVTIKDLARELDLSVSTVGRALAGSAQISVETRTRVQSAAQKRGYVAHSGARAMRSGRSTLVGLLIPDIRNDFYGTAAKALAECCDAAGFQLVLALTEEDPDAELRHVRSLTEARAAGVVIVGSVKPHPETLTLLERLPAVQLIRSMASLSGAWFGVDDAACLHQATQHLLRLGHRRIAYFGGTRELSTGSLRLSGYEAAFTAAKLPVSRDLVRVGPPRAAFAAAAFTEVWTAPGRPTAVVTAGARLADGVLDAVAALNIKVPDELSVIGFGDAPWFRWLGSGLTTIALPVQEIAAACGEYLLRRIREDRRGETRAERPFRSTHAPHLIERASTAPLAKAPAPVPAV